MKLFQYTTRLYGIYAIIILIVFIPVFYIMMQRTITSAVDTALHKQQQEIQQSLPSIRTEEEFVVWRKMQKDVKVTEGKEGQLDSINTSPFQSAEPDGIVYRSVRMSVLVNNKPYVLTIQNNLSERQSLLKKIIITEALLLLALLAGLAIINRVGSGALWKPFYGALKQLRGFDIEKQSALKLPQNKIEEFNELNETLHELTQKSVAAYESQKEFTQNAAHELQTPLSVFQSHLELLMQTQPLTQEQASLIVTLDDVSRRLSKLNQSLLLLARIENGQYHETEQLELSALCRKLVMQMQFEAELKHIRIITDYQSEYWLQTNKALIEILLTNLFSNAIRYNVNSGQIIVQCQSNSLTISNTGAAQPLDKERIFERFHKGENSQQGTGLGLTIAKKIAALYHLTIQYQYDDGLHEFRLTSNNNL